MYFLNYRFIVSAEAGILKRFSKFWFPFLSTPNKYDKFIEWKIHFFCGKETRTEVNQEDKEIIHYSNSVCQLTELNNLFREAVVKITALHGIVWLHCSAISHNGEAIIFLGNKGDGKTTLLLNYLKDKGNVFIGNDQLPVFLKNGQLCTLCWRPDIKIQSTTEKDVKELVIVQHKDLSFIDFDKMSKRIGKKITSSNNNFNLNFKANEIYPIHQIVVLNDNQVIEHCKYNWFIEKIDKDGECVLAYKLKNLAKYMSYWNKRIVGLNVYTEAEKVNKNILNACKSIDLMCIGNRLDFNIVKKALEKREK